MQGNAENCRSLMKKALMLKMMGKMLKIGENCEKRSKNALSLNANVSNMIKKERTLE